MSEVRISLQHPQSLYDPIGPQPVVQPQLLHVVPTVTVRHPGRSDLLASCGAVPNHMGMDSSSGYSGVFSLATLLSMSSTTFVMRLHLLRIRIKL